MLIICLEARITHFDSRFSQLNTILILCHLANLFYKDGRVRALDPFKEKFKLIKLKLLFQDVGELISYESQPQSIPP